MGTGHKITVYEVHWLFVETVLIGDADIKSKKLRVGGTSNQCDMAP